MRRATAIAIAVVGLLFPLGLAFAVYVASAGSLAEPTGVAAVPAQPIAQPTATVPLPRGTTERVTTAATTVERDDVSGKCDEPEHRSDPDCTALDDDGSGQGRGRGRGRGRGGDDSDSSGSGSGSDGSGSDNSGSDDSGGGSDSSGHGSGDD